MKKMSDVFNLPYLDSNKATAGRFKEGVTLEQINNYKAHAINVHDELVALLHEIKTEHCNTSTLYSRIDELLERCK